MGSNKPYKQLGTIEIPESVRMRISARITRAQRRTQQIRTIMYGAYFLLSAVVCVGAGISIISTLSQSGVFEFIALIFKDVSVLSYSKDLFLSIIESLPIFAIAFLLGGILFSGVTLPRFIRNRSQLPLYA